MKMGFVIHFLYLQFIQTPQQRKAMWREFFAAAGTGDVQTVDRLINRVDVNDRDEVCFGE